MLVLTGAVIIGRADAIEIVTPTPAPSVCDTVDIPNKPDLIHVGEGNIDRCIAVDAPDECCWTTTVDGYAELTSPEVQCGDHSACFHVYNCDCSGCRFPFDVVIAGQRIPGECQNYTPAIPTPTTPAPGEPTPTPVRDLCDTVALPPLMNPMEVGENGGEFCIPVDAPGDCCWTTTFEGYGALVSPELQCGDQNACFAIPMCDCSGCHHPFEVVIADQHVPGYCTNYTPTQSVAPTPIPTDTPTPTPTPTSNGTARSTDTPTPVATVTPSATPTIPCGGDCDADGAVLVDEVMTIVNIILGTRNVEVCPTAGNATLTVADVVTAINHAIAGCPKQTYRIRGQLAEFPDCSGASRFQSVTLEPFGLTTRSGIHAGYFIFENVPPGEYVIHAGCIPFGCYRGRIVHVRDSDVFVRLCPNAFPTQTPVA